jgi:hypothetical protein
VLRLPLPLVNKHGQWVKQPFVMPNNDALILQRFNKIFVVKLEELLPFLLDLLVKLGKPFMSLLPLGLLLRGQTLRKEWLLLMLL